MQNKNGYTPLICAVNFGYLKIIKFLVSNGTNINVKNKIGNTALIIAARSNHLETVKVLCKQRDQY